jgi:hypothetical protein
MAEENIHFDIENRPSIYFRNAKCHEPRNSTNDERGLIPNRFRLKVLHQIMPGDTAGP